MEEISPASTSINKSFTGQEERMKMVRHKIRLPVVVFVILVILVLTSPGETSAARAQSESSRPIAAMVTETTQVYPANNPPLADVGGPYSGYLTPAVSFDGRSSFDPEGDTLTYEWDLDNDGAFDDATGPTAGYQFATTGSHTICLQVSDPGGLSGQECTSVSVANYPKGQSWICGWRLDCWHETRIISLDPDFGNEGRNILARAYIEERMCKLDTEEGWQDQLWGVIYCYPWEPFHAFNDSNDWAVTNFYLGNSTATAVNSTSGWVQAPLSVPADAVQLVAEFPGFTYLASPQEIPAISHTLAFIINKPPVADDLVVTTAENAPIDITLTGSDADGDFLTYSVVDEPDHGSLNGSYPTLTYTPEDNFFGVDTFSFMANDGLVDSAEATVTVNVTAVNDPPTANDDSETTDEESAFTTGNVLDNDTDPDSAGSLSVSAIDTSGTIGMVTDNGDGTFYYDPNGKFEGLATGESDSDSFDYTLSDSQGGEDTATVTILITGVNDLPSASDDADETDEDTAFTTINVLANDTDADNSDTVSVSSLNTAGTIGIVTNNWDGTFEYDPNSQFETLGVGQEATDTFEYTLSDDNGGIDTATVTITIIGANEAPTADDDSYNTNEDTPLTASAPGVLDNDSDVDGLSLTAVLDTSTAHGTLTLYDNGSFEYAPNPDFCGSDSFSYQANDGASSSNIATVTIDVLCVNDPPTADDDNYSAVEDTQLSEGVLGLLDNDTDVDSPLLTAVRDTSTGNGVLTLNDDGSFDYLPNSDFCGLDIFTYQANDGLDYSNIATVTIDVLCVNDPPVADNQSVSTDEDTAVNITLSATDIEGDTLTYAVVSSPQHGVLNGQTPNLTYTPFEDYNGSDSFTFQANDGATDSNEATVTFTVDPINDPPVINTVSNNGPILEGGSAIVSVNASDVDGDDLAFHFDCENDGNFEIGPLASNSVTCGFADDGEYQVVVSVNDGDGSDDSASTLVMVDNAAPIVTPPTDRSELLGVVGPFDLGSFSDLGTMDSPWSVTVDWNDNFPSAFSLEASGPIGSLNHNYASAGWYLVNVEVTDKDDGVGSEDFQITIENPVPVISGLTPQTVVTGEPDFNLLVDGASFVSTSQVQWNGIAQETTYLSANQLQATIPATLIITAGTAEITVFNPEPGGGTSNLMAFYVTEETVAVEAYDSGSSTDPADSATASTDNGSATASGGTGTVVVAEYSDNPCDEELFMTSDVYFDVYLSVDSTFLEVQVTFDNVENGSELFWWDGTAWAEVEGAIYDPATNSISFVVTTDTSPSIDQLNGTEFGLVDGAPYALSASPAGHQVLQYSDSIIPVMIEASDAGAGQMTASVNLPWLTVSEESCGPDDSSTICTWVLTGRADTPPGEYEAAVTIADEAGNEVEVIVTFEILPEDARAFYVGSMYVATSDANDGTADIQLRATVQDISAAISDPDTDPYPGDISNAIVRFKNEAGAVLCTAPSVELIVPGDTSVGSAVCTWTADIGNSDAVPFEIHIEVDGYYVETTDNEVVIIVARPLDNFISGGGYLVLSDSEGLYAGGEGTHTNYGFNVKFNPAGTNLQGRVTIIIRTDDGHKYKFKSNKLTSLGVDMDSDSDGNNIDPPHYAEFEGKANLTDVTDEAIPISLDGNLTLYLTMHDDGEPGDNDTISITIWDGKGQLLFSSYWVGVQSAEQIVGGGNLQVR
ncbi:MAG: Ig-like domain-containing protein [Candidatus Promineifilaceae bacterium]